VHSRGRSSHPAVLAPPTPSCPPPPIHHVTLPSSLPPSPHTASPSASPPLQHALRCLSVSLSISPARAHTQPRVSVHGHTKVDDEGLSGGMRYAVCRNGLDNLSTAPGKVACTMAPYVRERDAGIRGAALDSLLAVQACVGDRFWKLLVRVDDKDKELIGKHMNSVGATRSTSLSSSLRAPSCGPLGRCLFALPRCARCHEHVHDWSGHAHCVVTCGGGLTRDTTANSRGRSASACSPGEEGSAREAGKRRGSPAMSSSSSAASPPSSPPHSRPAPTSTNGLRAKSPAGSAPSIPVWPGPAGADKASGSVRSSHVSQHASTVVSYTSNSPPGVGMSQVLPRQEDQQGRASKALPPACLHQDLGDLGLMEIVQELGKLDCAAADHLSHAVTRCLLLLRVALCACRAVDKRRPRALLTLVRILYVGICECAR
jgi:hypothetical protein